MAAFTDRLKQSLPWHVWERMLEIEFVDRSIALAGKAFASFFPLIIVIAALLPVTVRTAIVSTLTTRFGMRGDSLATARDAFASADDVQKATSLFGLLLTILFAVSFTTALQRIYLRAWRRPAGSRVGRYWRGAVCLLAILASMALLGLLRGAFDTGPAVWVSAVLSLAVLSVQWWFIAWLLLLGEVRPRVLLPTGVVSAVAISLYAVSATVWMPGLVADNEAQFGFFGIALALVSWFSGAAMCVLVGACIGPVLAEDAGRFGHLVRGRDQRVLIEGARPPLPAPATELTLRDAFRSNEY